MTVPLLHLQYGGQAPERAGLNHPSIAPYGGYETSDKEVLAISIQNEREWQSLCEKVLVMPHLTEDPRFFDNNKRVKNRAELDLEINKVFNRKTRKAMEDLLRAASIAYGALNSVDSLIHHPQLRRREVTLPDGQRVDLVAPAIQYSYEDETTVFDQVPEFGSHTEAIKTEFSKT